MRKITSKKITYWLLGETAGRTSVAVWKWLWGLPVESGGKVAEKVARESVDSMQESIAQLTNAVAKVVAAYELAKQQYRLKAEEFHQAEKQAQIAHSKGDLQAARIAVTKAITLEKILPQLSDRVAQAKATVDKAETKLRREIEKLEAYKLEMKNLETLSKVNSAMAEISQITTDFDLESARSQFANAKDSIEQKALLESAKADLSENPCDRFAGNALAKYFLDNLARQKAAVFYNSQSNYSNSLKDAFSIDLVSNGGEVTTQFDLGDPNFNPVKAVRRAIDNGTEALVLLANSSTLDAALSVARVNQNQLPLLAGDDVYTPHTLTTGGKNTVGMVLAIPWHIKSQVNSDFPQAAFRLWKAEVNWRTALAYDATQALIAGMKDNPTRQGIQQALSQAQFATTLAGVRC